MDELEQKLGAVLNNPQLMQQIMSMAQAMGSQAPPQPEEQKQPESQQTMPQIDPGMLSRLAGLSKQGSIDREQQALLKALHPYLKQDRISRLERAMRAAKMAKLARSFLGSGLLSQSGR